MQTHPFRIPILGYVFQPHWLPFLLTLLFLPLLILLGFWQLDRAEQKKIIQQEFNNRLSSSPFLYQDLSHINANSRYHPVVLTGKFDNAHSFLLDNKFYQHRIGYHVLTPFQLIHGGTVLIDRGWIPIHNRKQLPQLSLLTDVYTLKGYIDFPPQKPFLLKHEADNVGNWPLRVEAIELSMLSEQLKKPLFPFIVLLATNSPGGYVCDFQPTTFPYQRHIAYAVQWFAIALTLIVIFIAVNLKKRVDQ